MTKTRVVMRSRLPHLTISARKPQKHQRLSDYPLHFEKLPSEQKQIRMFKKVARRMARKERRT